VAVPPRGCHFTSVGCRVAVARSVVRSQPNRPAGADPGSAQNAYGDSAGAALALQLDAGVRLLAPLAVHATLIYDRSEWLYFPEGIGKPFGGSMLGFGLGATTTLSFVSLGLVAGGQ
jgi:hypothetical protein